MLTMTSGGLQLRIVPRPRVIQPIDRSEHNLEANDYPNGDPAHQPKNSLPPAGRGLRHRPPAEQSEVAADQRQQVKGRVPARSARVQSARGAASGNGEGEQQTEADQRDAQQ